MRTFLDNTLTFLDSIEMSPREALYLVTIVQLIILLYWKMIEQGNTPKWVKAATGVLSTLAMIINVLAIIIYTML